MPPSVPSASQVLVSTQFALRAWYLFYFASLVCLGPFLNVYFHGLGLTKAQVGVIGALRPWISAPASFLWAALADRLHAHHWVLMGTFVASCAARLLLLLPRGFLGILAVVLLAEVLASPVGVMADSAVMAACEKESDYGKYRLWGAVGWGVFSTVAGWLIDTLGMRSAFAAHLLLSLPCLYLGSRLYGLRKPGQAAATETSHTGLGGLSTERMNGHEAKGVEGVQGKDKSVHNDDGDDEERVVLLQGVASLPAELLSSPPDVVRRGATANGHGSGAVGQTGATAALGAGSDSDCKDRVSGSGEGRADCGAALEGPGGGGGSHYWRDVGALARRPEVLLFFVTSGAMGYGFGTIDSFLFLYLEQLGATQTLMGLTLTITCIAEVPAFQLQDRLLDRWGVTAVLDLVQAVYALRLALYALLPFAGPICIYLVLPVEVLHGITFACGWGAGTVNCKQLAPAGLAATLQGTFQGLYFGLGYGLGSLVAGAVSSRAGLQAMFGWASGTMLLFWLCTVAARRALGVTLSGRRSGGPGYMELTTVAPGNGA